MTLGIQDIVEVRAQITPRGAGGREFGENAAAHHRPHPGRWCGQGYGSLPAWTRWLGRSLRAPVPYQAAQVYFSQVPYPRNLVIGRWDQHAGVG